MPPLVRPTTPRHPWRRAARTIWRKAAPPAKAPSPNATTGASPRLPNKTDPVTAAVAATEGQNRRTRNSSADALRQGRTGAIAMRNSNARPIGIDIRSKYGAPTESRSSVRASTISGNTVPRNTTKARTANSTLLARNEPSRESGESIRPGERSRSPRQPIRPTVTTTITAKNDSNHGPMSDSLNAWTESSTPERVRNVPRIVSAKVAHSRDRFQTRSMPRRSWTITEWM